MKLALSGVNMSSCLVSYGAEVSGWLTVWSKGKRIYLFIYLFILDPAVEICIFAAPILVYQIPIDHLT